jgi:hypothetical protein
VNESFFGGKFLEKFPAFQVYFHFNEKVAAFRLGVGIATFSALGDLNGSTFD